MSTASEVAATPPDGEEDEELLPLAGRRRDDDEMDITPMIDITFLLLIFFVVASRMDPQQAVDLPRADHGLAIAADDAAVVIVREGATPERVEVVRGDGRPFSRDTEQQETEMVDYLTQELDSGKVKIVLQISGEARHGEVSRVRRAIGNAFDELEVVYIAVMEEP